MNTHLPVLQVIIPMLGAPICLLARHHKATRWLAITIAWTCLAIATNLLHTTLNTGSITYALGGWPPPIGIVYVVDVLNAFVLVLVSLIASVTLLFGSGTEGVSVGKEKAHLYYAAFLLCLSGLLGITITGDAFNIFVFLEIASLSAYTLVSLGHDRRALTAAYNYLIIGTIGGTFLLIGIGLLYQMTGSLNLADLAQLLPEVSDSRTIRVAFAFMVIGVSIKLALFPLHQWLPNAYTYAPTVVSAFLSATATKVSYYVLLRLIFGVFGATFVFGALKVQWLLLPLAIAAIFVGSTAALYQHNIKRLLAYSSVAQIGYLALGLSFHSVTGLTGGIVHLFNHGIMKSGLFLVVACMSFRTHSVQISDLRGIGKRMPITTAAFVVGGLSLIGVPGTVGFISKWYFVLAAIERGWIGIAVLILLASLLSVAYVWKIIEVAYFQESPIAEPTKEAPLSMLIPTWILIGLTVVFGVYTDWTVDIAQQAALALMGGI